MNCVRTEIYRARHPGQFISRKGCGWMRGWQTWEGRGGMRKDSPRCRRGTSASKRAAERHASTFVGGHFQFIERTSSAVSLIRYNYSDGHECVVLVVQPCFTVPRNSSTPRCKGGRPSPYLTAGRSIHIIHARSFTSTVEIAMSHAERFQREVSLASIASNRSRSASS